MVEKNFTSSHYCLDLPKLDEKQDPNESCVSKPLTLGAIMVGFLLSSSQALLLLLVHKTSAFDCVTFLPGNMCLWIVTKIPCRLLGS